MAGGYIEDFNSVHFCFRCGEVQGDIHEGASGRYVCNSCGEEGICTVQSAADLLNDMYLKGVISITDEAFDDLDIEFDINEDDDVQ